MNFAAGRSFFGKKSRLRRRQTKKRRNNEFASDRLPLSEHNVPLINHRVIQVSTISSSVDDQTDYEAITYHSSTSEGAPIFPRRLEPEDLAAWDAVNINPDQVWEEQERRLGVGRFTRLPPPPPPPCESKKWLYLLHIHC